jgi:hypothetical protein
MDSKVYLEESELYTQRDHTQARRHNRHNKVDGIAANRYMCMLISAIYMYDYFNLASY